MAPYSLTIVGLGIAAYFYFEAQDYPTAAAQLPALVAIVVAGLSLLISVEAFWARRREAAQGLTPVTGNAQLPNMKGVCRATVFASMIVAYVWSIEQIGYLLATPLYLLSSFLLFRVLRPSLAILVTALIVAVVYLVFVTLLNLPLPLLPAW